LYTYGRRIGGAFPPEVPVPAPVRGARDKRTPKGEDLLRGPG